MTFEITYEFIYATLIIFCRVGTICMFLPAIGDLIVSTQIRLTFTVLLSLCLMMALKDQIPTIPLNHIQLSLLIFNEVAIGLCIGIAIKIIQTALHTMGMIFAYNAGLSAGMMFDPSQGTQGSSYGNFLTLCFVILFLVNDLHLDVIRAIKHSYFVFKFDFFLTHYHDLVNLIVRAASDAFNIGIKLAAPIIMIGILINLGSGILSRLMPQMQVFFIILPVQITVHTSILLVTLGSLLIWFVEYYHQYLIDIFK